jgi:hypothetical protein
VPGLAVVALALLLVGVAVNGLSRAGVHSVGILRGDHQIGPLAAGAWVAQTFEPRYRELMSARLHLLRMDPTAPSEGELTVRVLSTNEVLTRRTVSSDVIPPSGTFVEALDQPLVVPPREPIEIRLTILSGQPGGIGVTALSGNQFPFGYSVGNGVRSESDILFVVDSRGGVAGMLDWIGRRAAAIAPYGPQTGRYAVLAVVFAAIAMLVLVSGLVPRAGSRDGTKSR